MPKGEMLNPMYSKHMHDAMSLDEFTFIKRVFKTNAYEAADATKGNPEYDPAHKFKFPFQCVNHNTVVLTERACPWISVDERSCCCMHKGGGDVISLINGKPGCPRGIQWVLGLSAYPGRLRLYAFMTRHSQHENRTSSRGSNELVHIMRLLRRMVDFNGVDQYPVDERMSAKEKVKCKFIFVSPACSFLPEHVQCPHCK